MRPLAVQVGHGQHIAAIVVVLANFRQPGNPRNLLHDFACLAVQLVQPFGTGHDVPRRLARIAFSPLAVHLRLAVTVHVVHDIRRVPGTGFDRPPHVVPPEEPAVQRIGFQLVSIRALLPVTGGLIRIRIEIRLLNDQLIAAVAVQISGSDFMDAIVALQRNGDMRFPGRIDRGDRCAGRAFLLAVERADQIADLTSLRRLHIEKVGTGLNRLGSQPSGRTVRAGLAVDVKRAATVRLQQPPAQVHSSVRLP